MSDLTAMPRDELLIKAFRSTPGRSQSQLRSDPCGIHDLSSAKRMRYKAGLLDELSDEGLRGYIALAEATLPGWPRW